MEVDGREYFKGTGSTMLKCWREVTEDRNLARGGVGVA